ncbi:MAG: hypothetical protein V2I40_02750 [Desulfobacteraceae bacterium]|nr:hypothetical protein [Desulfobacteraceae bacterium]
MDQKNVIPQMIKFNQTLFNTAFDTAVNFQDQVERVGSSMMDKADWLPDESRKIYESCVDAYKTGRDNFKSYVNEGFQQGATLFK